MTKQGFSTLIGNTDQSVSLGMDELERLQMRYFGLLSQQSFVAETLDYGLLERHRPMLEQLASIKNSGVTVFDLYQRAHVFTSYNFETLFGYDHARIASEDAAYFDSRIHPEDAAPLLAFGIQMLEHVYTTHPAARGDFKAINEYRILNRDGAYVRIVEQHQVLELDQQGNLWLALSVLDLSPRQGDHLGVQSTLVNFKTGMVTDLLQNPPAASTARLTAREREILQLIQRGHLSKEISDLLSISVHTVNTHRQRILEKLEVGNSMEAVQMAARLGLLGN